MNRVFLLSCAGTSEEVSVLELTKYDKQSRSSSPNTFGISTQGRCVEEAKALTRRVMV